MMTDDFEQAIWAAWAQLFVTTDEATAAIEKYRAGGFDDQPKCDECGWFNGFHPAGCSALTVSTSQT